MTPRTAVDWAEFYRSLGLSCIPIEPGTKLPARTGRGRLSWGRYQHALADDGTWSDWVERYWAKDAGIAIIQGPVSRLVVLDFDSHDALTAFEERFGVPTTAVVKTARGLHAYFCTFGVPIRINRTFIKGLDIQGTGSYVLAPPSRLCSVDGRYEWERPLTELAALPLGVYDALSSNTHGSARQKGAPPAKHEAIGASYDDENDSSPPDLSGTGTDRFRQATIYEGSRNDTLLRFTCTMLSAGVPEGELFGVARDWNQAWCDPPLSRAEVKRTVKSARGLHRKKGTSKLSFSPEGDALVLRLLESGMSERQVAKRLGRKKSVVHRAAERARRARWADEREAEGSVASSVALPCIPTTPDPQPIINGKDQATLTSASPGAQIQGSSGPIAPDLGSGALPTRHRGDDSPRRATRPTTRRDARNLSHGGAARARRYGAFTRSDVAPKQPNTRQHRRDPRKLDR